MLNVQHFVYSLDLRVLFDFRSINMFPLTLLQANAASSFYPHKRPSKAPSRK